MILTRKQLCCLGLATSLCIGILAACSLLSGDGKTGKHRFTPYEWRLFTEPSLVPPQLDELGQVLAPKEERTDVYLPVSEAVGVKLRGQTRLEVKRRAIVAKHDGIAGVFEENLKVKLGERENIEDVRAYLTVLNELTPDVAEVLSSTVTVVIAKKVRKGTLPGHPLAKLEYTELHVWCEDPSGPPLASDEPISLSTFSVEGPEAAVVAFIEGTAAGAALNELAHVESVITGGYPTLVMRLLSQLTTLRSR